MLKARIPALLVGALLGASAIAQTLNPDAPSRYVVQKGDTLWSIAGRFLQEPWRWSEVWEANPQIKDPHLIYPGDEILLVYQAGEAVLQVQRGPAGERPTIKLSPTVRAEPLELAIPTIPIDAIHQFLVASRVVTEDELAGAAYIVSVGSEALLARPGGKFFARGIDTAEHTRFVVLRRGQEYLAPESGELLGLEALHVGDAVLDVPGDPATLLLTAIEREVLNGDRLLPALDEDVDSHFLPRPPADDLRGQIIAVVDGVTQIGQHNIVVLNLGREHGIEAGHVLAVYQRGETISDEIAEPPEFDPVVGRRVLELDPEKQGGFRGAFQAADDYLATTTNNLKHFLGQFDVRDKPHQTVTLPDKRAGTLMVFRPFGRVSYALVMEASRAMHIHDAVRNP